MFPFGMMGHGMVVTSDGQIGMMHPMHALMGGGGGAMLAMGPYGPVLVPAPMMMAHHGGGLVMAGPGFGARQICIGGGGGGSSSSGMAHVDRDARLSRGPTKTLYHQTDAAAADSIVRGQQFHRGSGGSLGGGIYFAASPSATDAKAHSHGVVLEATVRLGCIKEVHHIDNNLTFDSLNRAGFDSVHADMFSTGDEWVVYNWDQATQIKIVRR